MRITGSDLAFALFLMVGWALGGLAVLIAKNSRRIMREREKAREEQAEKTQ